MSRIVVTKEELQVWLTREINEIKGCEKCSFGEITLLQEQDESGCNWSESIIFRSSGVLSEMYKPAVAKVMAEARSKFNIA
ncbi:MAG: hypothetical protein KA520_04805 [Nitrosomonas sp.]|nr:hypothetical protein [Nitrosomonas sp.]